MNTFNDAVARPRFPCNDEESKMRNLFTTPAARRRLIGAATACFAILASLTLASRAAAQPGPTPGRGDIKRIPSERYYRGVELIEAGRFSEAANFYNTELRGAMKLGTNLWIDSICYYAMLGETYYQSGNFDEALKNYNAALTVALAFPNWQSRVTYTSGVSSRPKGVSPWGASRRNCPVGVFPNKATIVVGEGESQASRQLGLVMEQHALPIDPVEILRCVALSIRRRAEIIGPLAPYDPMSAEILDCFRTRAVAPNHWSIVFLDVIWGFALEESDKTQSAVKTLNEALMSMGQCDHNLTGMALLELGNIFLKANKIREAAECYFEAADSAYQYGDALLLEEALRLYSNCYKGLRGGSVDPALAAAYRWAKTRRNANVLQTSLALELIEGMIYSGKLPQAKSGLTALETTTMRGEVRRSAHADRWNYLNALFLYATGETAAGDKALALVVEGAKVHSTWARQLGKLEGFAMRGLTANGALTPRNAADLYEYLLREPSVVDWAVRPTESLAIQMIAPIGAYERHFQLLFDRDLTDKAFEVAERIRRERFFATQTYGGRLVSLRYIMTADDALVSPSTRAARGSLNLAYPSFEESMKKTAAIMERLNAIPTVPTDRDSAKDQEQLFAELGRVAAGQEAMLHFIAAGRVRIPYVFPPVYSVEEVQKRLPDETAILSFIEAEGRVYGFMIGKESLDAWPVGSSSAVAAAVADFLKTIGNSEGTRYVENEFISDNVWKARGAKLREIVLGASDVEAERFNIVFSKLVVTPDSSLWYLPFEALCLPKSASSEEGEASEKDGADEENAAESNDDSKSDATSSEESQNAEDDAEVAAAREEQYGELDAAYLGSERESGDEEESEEETETEATPDEDAQVEAAPEATDAAKEDETAETDAAEEGAVEPKRRPSRNARKKAALEAYEETLMPMIAAPDFTIRYSATVSLALPNAVGRNAFVGTTLVAGTTYPRESPERVAKAVERFAAAVPKTEATVAEKMASIPGALYASRLRRLVVWEEIVADTWNWAPVVLGTKARAGNSTSAWIECPWGAPRLIVIPALRTRAENALKNGGTGDEIALAVLAMQTSGADTALLSRWRTGGRSAYDLSQNFVANYEKEPAADAWKDAVLALMKREVVVEEEPRLKKLGRSESVPLYTAPFWWAGYMLIDSGEAVESAALDELDEESSRKAEEEKALLEKGDDDSDAKKGDGLKGDELDAEEGDDGERAVFVDPKESEPAEAPFDSAPKSISDEELKASDELGDDFFATDEEDESAEKKAETPQPETPDDESDDAEGGDAAEPEEETGVDAESGAESGAADDDAKNATGKASGTTSKESTDSSAKDGKKSSGRLSLKGKGKSK